jgi:hypothetical protein
LSEPSHDDAEAPDCQSHPKNDLSHWIRIDSGEPRLESAPPQLRGRKTRGACQRLAPVRLVARMKTEAPPGVYSTKGANNA